MNRVTRIKKKRVSNGRKMRRVFRRNNTQLFDDLTKLSGGRSSVSGIVATVFGSSGFLGRYVIQRLGNVGSLVVAPYRGEEKSINHLKPMGDLGQIVPYKWNMKDKQSIKDAVKYSNVIINCVGTRWNTRNFTMEEVNVDFARTVAEIAAEKKVDRLIHVSCLGVDKNSPSNWSRTKALGEEAVREIFPDATIIRPSTMFGYEDHFLRYLGSMLRYWPVFVLFNGEKRIQPIWVDNVAEAIVTILALHNTTGKVFELGGPKVYTMKEIIDWLKIVLNHDKWTITLPSELERDFVKVLSMQRSPRITIEELKDKADKIVSENSLKMSDLLLKPSPMEREGFNFIQHYRSPVRYDELLPEDTEKYKDEKVYIGKQNPY